LDSYGPRLVLKVKLPAASSSDFCVRPPNGDVAGDFPNLGARVIHDHEFHHQLFLGILGETDTRNFDVLLEGAGLGARLGRRTLHSDGRRGRSAPLQVAHGPVNARAQPQKGEGEHDGQEPRRHSSRWRRRSVLRAEHRPGSGIRLLGEEWLLDRRRGGEHRRRWRWGAWAERMPPRAVWAAQRAAVYKPEPAAEPHAQESVPAARPPFSIGLQFGQSLNAGGTSRPHFGQIHVNI